MMRRVDRLWYRLLGVVNGWVVRRAQAHCRREMARKAKGTARGEAERRLHEHLAGQKAELN